MTLRPAGVASCVAIWGWVTKLARWARQPTHPPDLRPVIALVAVSALLCPAVAQAQAPSGPPGPPPGHGLDLPTAPGTAPAFVPPGTPATVPSGPTGPGSVSSASVAFNRAKRTFTLPLACRANGTITARGAAVGALGRARYRCAANRSSARFTVSQKIAKRVARARTVAATAMVRQNGKATKLWFTVRAGVAPTAAKGFWTDGHLQCSQDGAPQAYLAEPDFTTATPTTISTRGWVAWYTAAGGWHWLGVGGENAGRWDTWTATPTGVAQFHPNGAVMPTPWTWGPISVPTGQGITTVGVYEIVYWVGGRPDYQWQYVNAGTTGAVAAGAGTLFCTYP
jgi:hypothetical protein